jgi:hypothetical protein
MCRYDLPFELPEHLVEAAERCRLVIFAGAGVSTEKKALFGGSFLQDVKDELKPKAPNLSFPDAMSMFCERPDGRSDLLLKIRGRINYVQSHPELYWTATSFHRELSTIWQIQEIITTNWDDFFERECGATPFITHRDLAFWSQPGRRVLKLHGSIHSLGEIVVTAEDYEQCYRQLSTGVLGSRLKTLLADRTIVFVGYSLADPDLRRIVDALTAELGDLRPAYYVITPETAPDATAVSNIRHIKTDGTFFLRRLKAELLKSEHNLPDDRLERVPELRRRVTAAHHLLFARRPQARCPETIYCASYQDGLIHALDRALHLAKTGEYSHRCALVRKVQEYERIRNTHRRRRNYWDMAYTEGYMNGVMLVATPEDLTKMIPLYFIFGVEDQPTSFTAYSRLAAKAASLHRTSFDQASKFVKRLGSLVVHHPPFLDTRISPNVH